MPPAPPRFVCTDLRVSELRRSVRFYALLGLRPLARSRMDDGTRIAWMRDDETGQVVELFQLTPASPLYRPFRPSRETHRALIFTHPDLDPLLRRLQRAGARVELEFSEGALRLAFLRDPDGSWIELVGWVDPGAHSSMPLPLPSLVRAQRAAPPRRRARRRRSAGGSARPPRGAGSRDSGRP